MKMKCVLYCEYTDIFKTQQKTRDCFFVMWVCSGQLLKVKGLALLVDRHGDGISWSAVCSDQLWKYFTDKSMKCSPVQG